MRQTKSFLCEQAQQKEGVPKLLSLLINALLVTCNDRPFSERWPWLLCWADAAVIPTIELVPPASEF